MIITLSIPIHHASQYIYSPTSCLSKTIWLHTGSYFPCSFQASEKR